MMKEVIKQENIEKKIDKDSFIEDADCKMFDYIIQHGREVKENEYFSKAMISFV